MDTPLLIVAILVITIFTGVTVFEVWDRRRRWKWLTKRRPHHRLWLRYAPPERQEYLEDFITGIANAWLIPRAKAFALRPSDDLHKIYRHIYRYSYADTLEYEILFEHLEDSGLRGDRIQQPTLRIGDLAREWLEVQTSTQNRGKSCRQENKTVERKLNMKKSRIVLVCGGALAITTLFCVNGCILHWPGAPYTDTSAALGNDALMALRSRYADAKLISPVFRRHLDRRRDKSVVTDQLFLFSDASGQSRRGHIDAEGRLTVHPVTFVDRLPEELQKAYFDSKAPLVAGGQVTGRVWRFNDEITNHFVYEFEFTVGTLRGIGLIDASGIPASADYIVPNEGGCRPKDPNQPVDATAKRPVVKRPPAPRITFTVAPKNPAVVAGIVPQNIPCIDPEPVQRFPHRYGKRNRFT